MNTPDEADERDPGAQNAKLEHTVQVYVRPELLLEPVDSKIQTLQTLEAEGIVDGLLLHYWPSKVELSANPPHSEAIDAYERFRMWADARGVEIDPPFSVRSRSSEITGEERTVLSTPVVCLAVYDAGRLVGVYPHSDGEQTHTVGEAIAALQTGQFPVNHPELTASTVDVATEPAGTGASTQPSTGVRQRSEPNPQCSKPNCDGAFANVQGVLVCTECRRSATTDPDPARRVLAGSQS